jgi:ABC-type sugar transport system ATPase subunit
MKIALVKKEVIDLMNEALALEMIGIHKSFGSNFVLRNLDFSLRKGEVHALLGINGAGKSTLIKIISGAYTQDKGTILVDGTVMGKMTPSKAFEHGIATIYQETSLYPKLSVAENLVVGRRLKKGPWLDWKKTEMVAKEVFDRMGIKLDLYDKVENIGKANAQLVEIARSLAVNAKILIMDEPTSSLSSKETDNLFDIIHRLKNQGTSIIYISHRMEEVFKVADRLTVLRDGKAVGTKDVKDAEVSWITQAMLGKETEHNYHLGGHCTGEPLLEVKHLNSGNTLHDINLCVRCGEIVALAGLVGSGRTETAKAIVGIDTYDSGEIIFKNQPLKKHDFRNAIRSGIGLIAEDRANQGLVLDMNAHSNIVMSAMPKICRRMGIRNKKKETGIVARFMENLLVNPNSPEVIASNFSGGNQQKLVLGKWLATEPELLIMDEPTCGVDVGSKFEIYKLIDKLAAEGKGILVISSDLTDIEILADKIYVMRNGRIVKQLSKGATRDEILKFALSGDGTDV